MSTLTGGAKQTPLSVALDSIQEITNLLHDKTNILMDKLAPVRLKGPPPEPEKNEKTKEAPVSEVVSYVLEQNRRLNDLACEIQQLIDEVEV